jgi:hypothetical protein
VDLVLVADAATKLTGLLRILQFIVFHQNRRVVEDALADSPPKLNLSPHQADDQDAKDRLW